MGKTSVWEQQVHKMFYFSLWASLDTSRFSCVWAMCAQAGTHCMILTQYMRHTTWRPAMTDHLLPKSRQKFWWFNKGRLQSPEPNRKCVYISPSMRLRKVMNHHGDTLMDWKWRRDKLTCGNNMNACSTFPPTATTTARSKEESNLILRH